MLEQVAQRHRFPVWKDPSVPNRIQTLFFVVLGLCLAAQGVSAQAPTQRPTTGGTRPPVKKPATPVTNEASRPSTVPKTTRPPAGRATVGDEPADSAEPGPATKPRPVPQGPAQQGPQPTAKDGPAPKVVMQPISEEMKKLLHEWEQETKGVKSLSCPMTRYEFDSVFAKETRSTGTLYFENPDKGRIDFEPADKERLAIPSGRQDAQGKPFKVLPGTSSKWICTGKMIYILDMTSKSYDRIQIPPQMQGQNITQSPLPFIFGMKAQDAMKRFAMRFGQFNDPTGAKNPDRKIYHIVANPLQPNVAREYIQAEIILDAATFRPLNLRTVDPSGNKETVYSFNLAKLKEQVGWGLTNPFKDPQLIGWELMHDIKAEPEDPPVRQAQKAPK